MKNKTPNGVGLHQWIAQGGDPKDYKGTKGLNSETVNNLKK